MAGGMNFMHDLDFDLCRTNKKAHVVEKAKDSEERVLNIQKCPNKYQKPLEPDPTRSMMSLASTLLVLETLLTVKTG